MVRITFISDGTPPVSTKLCDSTRTLAEYNLRFNQQRAVDIQALMRSAFAVGFDRKNRRNSFSFDVSRSQNFNGDPFGSPESAFSFAIRHVNGVTGGGDTGSNDLGGSGTLKIELTGESGFSITLYMHNALLQSVAMTDASLGICVGLSYEFNGGIINETA